MDRMSIPIRKTIYLLAIMLVLLVCGCSTLRVARRQAPDTDYVQVDGQHFTLNGQPCHYVGVNYWYAPLLGMEGDPGDRTRLIRELDELQKLGLRNLRIIAISEISSATGLVPAAQPAPGVYNEAWFRGLDFALSELDKRGMKAVLYVSNYWYWSGGMAQLVNWTTGEPIPPEKGDWQKRNAYITSFYQNPEAQALYYRAVDHLLNRVNTVSGRLYLEDPTIMSWQLCNEPRPGTYEQTVETAPYMLQWVSEAADHFHKQGIHQLISIGSEGLFGVNGNEQLYRDLHALDSIDYLTVHLWPQNWLWFDPKDGEGTIERTIDETRNYLDQHIAIARDLNKPMVLEEFGLARDGGGFTPDSSVVFRNRFLRLVGDVFEQDLAEGGPFAGINIWSWGGDAIPTESAGRYWHQGDIFTGDNPIEPQGWYSIFKSDHESIRILSDLAKLAEE